MSSLATLALIAGITAAGFALADRTRLGGKLGPTLIVLSLGLLITNLSGLRPDPAAEAWVNGPLTSLAIAQLLLAVDLRRVLPQARRLLAPFLVAVGGTCLAVLLAGWLLREPLGESLAPLAGVYAATFTGGSLNFVSVSRTMSIPADLVLLATTADHLVFAVWFLLSLWLGRQGRAGQLDPSSRGDEPAPGPQPSPDLSGAGWPWRLRSLAASLLVGIAVVLLSDVITAVLQRLQPDFPAILVLTSLALLAAQWPALNRNGASYGLGLVLIHPFFAVIGLSSPLAGLISEGRWVLLYAVLIVAVQALLLLLIQRLRRWPLGETLVASQAAIGGPSTALALGVSLGRRDLALPAIAIGLLGYLLGTYLGLAVAKLFGSVLTS